MLVADEDVEQHRAAARSCRSSSGRTASGPTPCDRNGSPLERLDVVDLSARYPTARAVGPISFVVAPGQLHGGHRTGRIRQVDAAAGRCSGSDGSRRSPARCAGTARRSPIPARSSYRRTPRSCRRCPSWCRTRCATTSSLGPMDMAQIDTALQLAAISDDIRGMPKAEDTLIGPRGLRLSGGQRQRLATARALVHRPELIVLDDLSSAVDVETELRLWENLAARRPHGDRGESPRRRLRARRPDHPPRLIPGERTICRTGRPPARKPGFRPPSSRNEA